MYYNMGELELIKVKKVTEDEMYYNFIHMKYPE